MVSFLVLDFTDVGQGGGAAICRSFLVAEQNMGGALYYKPFSVDLEGWEKWQGRMGEGKDTCRHLRCCSRSRGRGGGGGEGGRMRKKMWLVFSGVGFFDVIRSVAGPACLSNQSVSCAPPPQSHISAEHFFDVFGLRSSSETAL